MAFDITLNPPNICLIPAESQSGINIIKPDGLKFGSVYQINLNTTTVDVGDVVLFNETKSILVTQGFGNYFIINENDLEFRDDYIVP